MIIEVAWTNTIVIKYADKTIGEILGKIATLSELENVVNLSGNSNSQSISITLSDTDGTIKNIYNTNDVHKRPVKVYQWFDGLPVEEAFIIYEGLISSPIVWKEGDRTFSFDVVSKLEDVEVGFSIEEGDFANVPYDLIGKAWPLPFGTCIKVPALKVDPIPSGVTNEPTLIPDPSLDAQISKLGLLIKAYASLATDAFLKAIVMYYNSHYDASGSYNLDRVNSQFESQGDQFTAQGNQYLVEQHKAMQDLQNLVTERGRQRGAQKSSVGANGAGCFPQGQDFNVSFGGADHTGSFGGDGLSVKNSAHPLVAGGTDATKLQTIPIESTQLLEGQDTIQKLDFFWIPAGQVIYVNDSIPVRYIAAMLPCTVINVWSKRTFGGTSIDTQVPTNFYSVGYQSFGSIVATIITFVKPLSQYQDEGWDDEIFVDLVSPYGPNTVGVMEFLISNYTNLGIDGASFSTVANQLSPFPSNFCLFDRRNIIQVLTDIAYLSRCAIWIKEGVFYLRYLVVQPTPVDTITLEDDVLLNTLELDHTSTEEIVTKLTASFKVDYSQQKDQKVIVRNNTSKYGVMEQSTDWFIYNTPAMVQLAATFWSIRKSNTFKLLKFRSPIHKLRLETFDAVTINFSRPYASNVSVTGIVNSVKFDSDQLELAFEVWLPVRLGEMNVYYFFWPPDSTVLVYSNESDFGTNTQTSGDLGPINRVNCDGQVTVVPAPRIRRSGASNPGSAAEQSGAAVVQPRGGATYDPYTFNPAPGSVRRPGRPTSNYTYRNYRTSLTVEDLLKRGAFPAQIVSGPVADSRNSGPKNNYVVSMFQTGLSGRPVQATAKVASNEETSLAPGTWVMVTVNIFDVPDIGGDPTKTIKVIENSFIVINSASAFAAQVISGSGNLYQMSIYKNGITKDPIVAAAIQMQIDVTDTIPAGSWTLVAENTIKIDGGSTKEYTMQFPVWLQ